MRVPKKVKKYLNNSKYLLESLYNLPPSNNTATIILLLITSWENFYIAKKELDCWINKTKVDPKLYKSHIAKLNGTRGIEHIIINLNVHKTITYSSPEQLKKLREYCQYGVLSNSNDISEIFSIGWHYDEFQSDLENKIRWLDGLISMCEEL